MATSSDHYYSVFNADGRILLIDFALEPTNSSNPFIAMRTRDGIFVAAKKENFENLEVQTNRTVVKINKYTWMAITGRTADVDSVIINARRIAIEALNDLGFEPTADILARLLADSNHKYIIETGTRACSFTCVLFGFDENPEIWQTDTSAVLHPYFAIGLGNGNLKMNKFLEKNYMENMTDEGALMCVVKGLGESIGSDFSPASIDVIVLKKGERVLKYLTVDEIDMVAQKISESE